MNEQDAMQRLVRAVELLASSYDRQANCAEQQLKLQAEMVNNQKLMAQGTAALEARLAGSKKKRSPVPK